MINFTRLKDIREDNDINQTQITKENSNNFEKYRYTFKLNNNEYNFVKVEKIK